jgi:hypothetical protein
MSTDRTSHDPHQAFDRLCVPLGVLLRGTVSLWSSLGLITGLAAWGSFPRSGLAALGGLQSPRRRCPCSVVVVVGGALVELGPRTYR